MVHFASTTEHNVLIPQQVCLLSVPHTADVFFFYFLNLLPFLTEGMSTVLVCDTVINY